MASQEKQPDCDHSKSEHDEWEEDWDDTVFKTKEGLIGHYAEWASTWDKDFLSNYTAPGIVLKEIEGLLGKRKKEVRILDVAGGTGPAGEALSKGGFTHNDILDASPDMIECAKAKGIFDKCFCGFMEVDPFPGIDSESYDALVCIQGFIGDHMKCECLQEFNRILKKGGYVLITTMEEYVIGEKADEDLKNLEPTLDKFWTRIKKEIVTNYVGTENGLLYIYQKST